MTEVLDSRALVLGSATINNGMMPAMADLLSYMKGLRPVGKVGAAFGAYGWSGEAVKLISEAMRGIDINLVGEGVRVKYSPKKEDLDRCIELGRQVARAALDLEVSGMRRFWPGLSEHGLRLAGGVKSRKSYTLEPGAMRPEALEYEKSVRKVLFLCHGNACRSIMAEALARHFWGNGMEACSAGLEPPGVYSVRHVGSTERGGHFDRWTLFERSFRGAAR